ncbi:MAG: prfA, partial [Acidobacteria bacterium]|nr:prfA [Acidobacteriota bacterium]
MLDKISGIEERYSEIDRQLMEVGTDYQRAGELNKERIEIEPIVEIGREYRQAMNRLEEARQMLESEQDEELRMLAEAEV